jgi:hypothetical protein
VSAARPLIGFREAEVPAREVAFEILVADVGRVASALYALHCYLHRLKEENGSDTALLLSDVLERRVEALRELVQRREGLVDG